MEKRCSLWSVALICSMFALSGCSLIDWGKCQYGQGCSVPRGEPCAQRYIRTVRIYDDITTLGIFDILWLSADVQRLYLSMDEVKYNLSPEKKQARLDEIARDVDTYISFYVLAYQPKVLGPIFAEENAFWSILLSVDGQMYQPVETKELDEEDFKSGYKMYLFDRLSKHRKIFFVRYAAAKDDGSKIITPQTDRLELCIRSFKKQAAAGWQLYHNDGFVCAGSINPNDCNQSGVEKCGSCVVCKEENRCDGKEKQ